MTANEEYLSADTQSPFSLSLYLSLSLVSRYDKVELRHLHTLPRVTCLLPEHYYIDGELWKGHKEEKKSCICSPFIQTYEHELYIFL